MHDIEINRQFAFNTVSAFCKNHDLGQTDLVITGGAALCIYGIINTFSNIDVTVTAKLFQQLSKKYQVTEDMFSSVIRVGKLNIHASSGIPLRSHRVRGFAVAEHFDLERMYHDLAVLTSRPMFVKRMVGIKNFIFSNGIKLRDSWALSTVHV